MASQGDGRVAACPAATRVPAQGCSTPTRYAPQPAIRYAGEGGERLLAFDVRAPGRRRPGRAPTDVTAHA